MSEKQQWPLADAEQSAQFVEACLRDACSMVQIAGSVRRKAPTVGDIEVLCVPRPLRPGWMGYIDDLDHEVQRLIDQGILEYRLNSKGARAYGPLNKFLRFTGSGLPLDIFCTTQENWGMSLVVRTGPRDFCVKVMQELKRRGARGHAYGGITLWSGQEVSCPTEEEVFAWCGWGWIPPEDRR